MYVVSAEQFVVSMTGVCTVQTPDRKDEATATLRPVIALVQVIVVVVVANHASSYCVWLQRLHIGRDMQHLIKYQQVPGIQRNNNNNNNK
jgi:hypothetical protein